MAVKARETAVVVNAHNMLFPEDKVSGLDEDDLSILKGLNDLL